MTCGKAQSLITPFINDQLNMKEVEEFIDHVQSCSECREELEVYYTLLTAMKQLDEEKNLSDDFNMELSAKIERIQEKIIHERFAFYRKKGILIFIIFFVAFLANFRYANMNDVERNPVTVSEFRLRRSFHKYDILDTKLQNFLMEQETDQ